MGAGSSSSATAKDTIDKQHLLTLADAFIGVSPLHYLPDNNLIFELSDFLLGQSPTKY